ncbi:MAG: helix-turn-helix transcriptional regulator [Bacteroidota bacterium]|nr:helix-turn-helix transcriptional regulator [Bacteroidota bacterium]MDP4232268.1 helix-turn-helix transcriptional regulator [Bacteroidota bacterium]
MSLQTIVASNVRGFRIKRNMTQEELAIKSKMSPNFLACFERGETGLALARLEKNAKTLKVLPHVLLIPESYKQP